MIEDKFGAELPGLQLPLSAFPRPPSALQAAEAGSLLPFALPCLRFLHAPLHPPFLQGRGRLGVGTLWADPSQGADGAGVPPLPPTPPCSGHPAAVQGGAPSTQGRACAGPLPSPHTSPPLPHQPVAQLRCSVPAPSWSLPHLPTPTGRSTGGKRAPGPPDQTAPAVLLKVRGTPKGNRGTGGGQRDLGIVPEEAHPFFCISLSTF